MVGVVGLIHARSMNVISSVKHWEVAMHCYALPLCLNDTVNAPHVVFESNVDGDAPKKRSQGDERQVRSAA